MWEYTHYDELYHYGVKGMKWGVRRAQKKLAKAQKQWDKKAKKYDYEAHKAVIDNFNKNILPKVNAKWEKHKWSDPEDWTKDVKDYDRYEREMNDAFDKTYEKVYDKKLVELIGERPS